MTTIKFEPFGARIVVLPDGAAEKKGDILLPETAKKEVVTGKIVAIYPAVLMNIYKVAPDSAWNDKELHAELQQAIPKLGDKARFLAHTGNEIEVDGVKYLVLDEHCILGRFL
jgi:co-chaperonin GroES (HSP10)